MKCVFLNDFYQFSSVKMSHMIESLLWEEADGKKMENETIKKFAIEYNGIWLRLLKRMNSIRK